MKNHQGAHHALQKREVYLIWMYEQIRATNTWQKHLNSEQTHKNHTTEPNTKVLKDMNRIFRSQAVATSFCWASKLASVSLDITRLCYKMLTVCWPFNHDSNWRWLDGTNCRIERLKVYGDSPFQMFRNDSSQNVQRLCCYRISVSPTHCDWNSARHSSASPLQWDQSGTSLRSRQRAHFLGWNICPWRMLTVHSMNVDYMFHPVA